MKLHCFLFTAVVLSVLALNASAAPFRAGIRFLKNPLALDDVDSDNLPMWYPVALNDTTPAWNFSGGYPSGMFLCGLEISRSGIYSFRLV